jgi:phospholipid/cholesterol/gamma-HCH transport system substrate-binding protein
MARLVAVGAMVAIGLTGWQVSNGSRPYQVTAYFISASQLVQGNQVTSGGVPVGTVSAVQLAPDGSAAGALVTLQIDRAHAPLRRGTRATIRPKGLLGNMHVELSAVRTGQQIPAGGTIPLQDTAAPVTLDQITDILDPQTRRWMQILTRQGGAAFQGRGEDVNHLLTQLPHLSADLAATAAAIDGCDQDLDALTVEFDHVATMVAGEDRSLRGDLQSGATLLDTLAQHQQALQQELTSADSSISRLNAALGGHEQDLNQLLKEVPQLLDDLRALSGNATTTFTIVDPCISDLVNTLTEIGSATDYPHPAGSQDGAGYMLRVDPQLVGPSNGAFAPLTSCSGGGR